MDYAYTPDDIRKVFEPMENEYGMTLTDERRRVIFDMAMKHAAHRGSKAFDHAKTLINMVLYHHRDVGVSLSSEEAVDHYFGTIASTVHAQRGSAAQISRYADGLTRKTHAVSGKGPPDRDGGSWNEV